MFLKSYLNKFKAGYRQRLLSCTSPFYRRKAVDYLGLAIIVTSVVLLILLMMLFLKVSGIVLFSSMTIVIVSSILLILSAIAFILIDIVRKSCLDRQLKIIMGKEND